MTTTTATAVRTLSGLLRWATRSWRTRRMWRAGLAWRHATERRLFRQGHTNIRGWLRAVIAYKRYMAISPEEAEELKKWLPLLKP